ncbi:putative multiple sugar transport system permease protein [Herbinix hemicellulosilytica]|uniref:Xylose transport system permease protein XylH n=1 Tax=Herbinix hemicellulosilytica TaxID=1564487 RepID=A0A0H5SIS4_HERHM|nr:multiple monosaccharide ABC transporter permease [Herbinix hemicellulosilytica]RBP59591.1 putative multiple sugar transport system permease protein [Herbinix hemicellulosilytica]CRZ34696.1 putative membrane protein [Herbinix hemicellulosilytica]
MDKVKEVLKKNTMLVALIIVTVIFSIGTGGKLLYPRNVAILIGQNSYVVILAVGMLMCILTGGNIDLSVGSIVALIGAIAGTLIVNMNVNIWVSIIVCLLIGILIGVWQGFWIAYIRIPAFIVTLAGMLIWRGVALIVLNGLTINPFPENYLKLFNSNIPDIFSGSINITALLIGAISCIIYIALQVIKRINAIKKGYEPEKVSMLAAKSIVFSVVIMVLAYTLAKHEGVPTILIILLAVVLIYSYFTNKTVPGRYIYAMGGNEKAAKLSGINTNKVLFFTYVNMAFLSAVAALVCVARFNSAAPTAGQNYEMDAIGSCFIGGASAYGGIGKVSGVVIGAIFMGVLNNGMSIMGVDTNIQKVVKGLVLLAAVAFDVISKSRKK